MRNILIDRGLFRSVVAAIGIVQTVLGVVRILLLGRIVGCMPGWNLGVSLGVVVEVVQSCRTLLDHLERVLNTY